MRRSRISWLAVGALIAVPLMLAEPADAGTRPVSARLATPMLLPTCTGDDGSDFDGDGKLDVAVGVPGEDRGSVANAGVVEVRHPCSSRSTESIALPHAHAGDGFGAAIAVGPLNDDGYPDLVVGVPGLDVSGHHGAGGVAIFYGSSTGLHYAKTLTQASPHVAGSVQAHARFGSALSLHGYLPDRSSYLRIGEPGRTVSGAAGAGGVVDYVVFGGHVVASRSDQITLATAHMPGSPGAGDHLGAAVYGDRVGAPGRKVAGAAGAGAVLVTEGRYSVLMTQASAGVPGTPEAGDHFGASLAHGWIGVPGEAVGDLAGAGVVERPATDPADRVSMTQHDADPAQVVEAGDHFGAAMTETGVVVDDTEWSPRQLLVGAPGQTVGGHADAGTVSVIGEVDDPDGEFSLGSSYGSIQPATAVTGAQFGSVLARDGLHTVQVGAPGAGGGVLSLFTAPSGYDGLPVLAATWTQEAGVPETGDQYAGALTLSPL